VPRLFEKPPQKAPVAVLHGVAPLDAPRSGERGADVRGGGIGEAVYIKEEEKKRGTLTTAEPFNCRGLDISSKPLTSCSATPSRGAQHLFYLPAD